MVTVVQKFGEFCGCVKGFTVVSESAPAGCLKVPYYANYRVLISHPGQQCSSVALNSAAPLRSSRVSRLFAASCQK